MAKKVSVDLVGKPKVKITLAEGEIRNFLFGAKTQFDENGRCFVIVEATPEVIQYTKDLHPDWEMSEPFYEIPEGIDAPEVEIKEDNSKGKKRNK